ncbi:iron-containing redox enzyme family protein [Cellulomonas fimi]|uniref:Iron-containing redox enzyme family protein n=1 Tax=Cellulomonas fimi TaxID=1708 RepID=A0A7Y0LX67_CELFI|nr:iron-containing redox enzyme family protein [Cellulomonas fimi]NMR19823.1 iron-containing redox enzyme family protein [Cellulomonas fimi]
MNDASTHPRGPVSRRLLRTLTAAPRTDDDAATLLRTVAEGVRTTADVVADDDLQLALLCLYELHYRGLDGVDERWEWHPALLGARAEIEEAFEAALRRDVTVDVEPPRGSGEAVAAALFELTSRDTGPGLARYVARRATPDQLRELIVHRSVYHLKEADPHSFMIPRLAGTPKSALIEIQADEYGGGSLERMHSVLFARTMRGLGLDDTYGAYVDHVPAITLAWVNVMSLFGLHRRLRGACVGHLAAFEMTSSIPCRLYGNGFRRHGFGDDVTWYFDEHVEADAVHEQIAGRDLAGALAVAEPQVQDDVVFGAATYLALDERMSVHLMSSWERAESSLLAPVDAAA